MKLLTAVGPERMKFTQIDQELYDSFRESFPEFDIKNVDEESMKNKEGKEKWRNWCEQYKERVQDYNFGTLLRLDPANDYTEQNSCFALRVQFLAIEIARNKEGQNQKIYDSAKAAKEAAAASGGHGCCSKC